MDIISTILILNLNFFFFLPYLQMVVDVVGVTVDEVEISHGESKVNCWTSETKASTTKKRMSKSD